MQYHVAKNGEKSGPFDQEEVYRRLVAGELSGTDLGWHEGMAEWEPLSKLPQTPIAASTTGAQIFGSASSAALVSLSMRPKTSGLAVNGLANDYISNFIICITMLALIAAPAFSQVQQKNNQMKAVVNAKHLVLGMNQYAIDHADHLPSTLEALYEEKILEDRQLLDIPGEQNLSNKGQAWEYRGEGLKNTDDGNTIVLISRVTYNSDERVLARLDGTVETALIQGPNTPAKITTRATTRLELADIILVLILGFLVCALIWFVHRLVNRKAIQQHVYQLQLPQAIVPIFPEISEVVAQKLAKMDNLAQHAFIVEFNKRKKSSFMAFILWFALGLHYAYLGRVWITIVFMLSLGGLWIWWFIDLFRIPSMVRDYNKSVAINVLRDIQFLHS
jgi:type II secretory pathway pseudopilin PulG